MTKDLNVIEKFIYSVYKNTFDYSKAYYDANHRLIRNNADIEFTKFYLDFVKNNLRFCIFVDIMLINTLQGIHVKFVYEMKKL